MIVVENVTLQQKPLSRWPKTLGNPKKAVGETFPYGWPRVGRLAPYGTQKTFTDVFFVSHRRKETFLMLPCWWGKKPFPGAFLWRRREKRGTPADPWKPLGKV